MERREFLRTAAAGAAGLMLPAEKEIIDDRLTRKVSLAVKGVAFWIMWALRQSGLSRAPIRRARTFPGSAANRGE